MGKVKKGIILVLTAIMLILCGMLPTIIARVEDYVADEKTIYGEMKTVQLIPKLNDTQKMYLLKTGSDVEISEERTMLKSENMREVVNAALFMYIKNDYIVGNIEDFSMKCEPLLYYSKTISNLSGIFWKIDMELWDDFGQSIHMYIDDQTGRILLISYECLEQVYKQTALANHIQFLFTDYQSGMDWFDYENAYGEENEEYYDAKTITYRMGDAVYGEIGIKFIMTEYGFSIEIE